MCATQHIRQIALGHAHTVVLGCDAEKREHLYVFGSNHYGQLGLGQTHSTDDTHVIKSLVPVVLSIAKPIRLIHTKFFTNVSTQVPAIICGCYEYISV